MIIGGRMYLCYNNQKIELCCQDGFKNRLMGIMFKKDKLNKALYFKRCNSIHTFFCKQDIAVIMTYKDDRIIYFNNKVRPNKVIIKLKAYNTYELPVGYFKKLKVNTYLRKEEC